MSTKIFFATDLHGSEKCFLKFVNAAKFYEANTLIMGGDITGKIVIPIVKEPNGKYRERSWEISGQRTMIRSFRISSEPYVSLDIIRI